ncbi:MAG: hypothetical protein ACR2QJ_16615 [Geminicoccaceae bacterium]
MTIYILFAKRRFDFFSISGLGVFIYFLPGLFGYVAIPRYGYPGRLSVEIIPETYVVMSIVTTSVFLGAFISDCFYKPSNGKNQRDNSQLTLSSNILLSLVLFTSLCFVMVVILAGDLILAGYHKSEILSKTPYVYGFLQIGGVLMILTSNPRKNPILFSYGLLIGALDLIIGHREVLAISLVGFLLKMFASDVRVRLYSKLAYAFVLLPFGVAVLVIKTISLDIDKGKTSADVLYSLFDYEIYWRALIESEPFGTQGILNKVLESNFTVGMDHLYSTPLGLMVFAGALGADDAKFNSLVQPVLFPGLSFGLAGNTWAELWSSGGWLVLVLGVIIWAILLSAMSSLLTSRHHFARVYAWFTCFYIAVLIHRTDLAYQFHVQKYALLFSLIVFSSSSILGLFGKMRKV